MSEAFLSDKEVSIGTVLILSYLLVKKSAYTISQLAKFIKTGNNKEIYISTQFKEFFQKTEAFRDLSEAIGTHSKIQTNKWK